MYTCDDCGLYKQCKTPRIKGRGNRDNPKIIFIGEAPGCFLGDTPIITSGRSQIMSEIVCDKTLINGNTVLKDLSYHVTDYDVVKLRVVKYPEIVCTASHKILIRYRNTRKKSKLPTGLSAPTYASSNEIVGLLDRGYQIFTMVPKLKHIGKQQVLDIMGHKSTSKYTSNTNDDVIPDSIIVDSDVAFMLGCYMGDGSSNVKSGIVKFNMSCGYKEEAYNKIKLVLDKYNIPYYDEIYNKSRNIVIVSRTLAKMFIDAFGTRAYNKRIPNIIFDAETNVISSFLFGWYETDGGHLDRNNTHAEKITTVSKMAAWDAVTLGLKCNTIIGVAEWWSGKDNELPVYDVTINSSSINNLGWNKVVKARPTNSNYTEDDNYFYLRVTKAVRDKYTGTVYDKTTEGHYYNIPFTVHNSEEDENGSVFVGPSGKLLDRLVGQGRWEHIYVTNLVKCCPYKDPITMSGGIRTPIDDEVKCCKPYFLRELELFDNTKTILMPLGNTALTAIVGENGGITKEIGKLRIVDIEGRKWKVIGNYHPAYLLRKGPGTTVEKEFENVLNEVMGMGGDGEEGDDVWEILDPPSALKTLAMIKEAYLDKAISYITYDTETSGLITWRDEIIMYSMYHPSIMKKSVSIPLYVTNTVHHMDYPYEVKPIEFQVSPRDVAKIDSSVGEILNLGIPLIGHQLKYDIDMSVNRGICDLDKIRVHMDTLIRAQIIIGKLFGALDLGSLCIKLFGAPNWETPVSDYRMRFKRVADRTFKNVPTYILGRYSAYDGYYNDMLYNFLLLESKEELSEVFSIQEGAISVFAEAEIKGIKFDEETFPFLQGFYTKYRDEEIDTMKRLIDPWIQPRLTKLIEDNAAKKNPKPLEEIINSPLLFNPNSTPQKRAIVFDYYKCPVLKRGKKKKDGSPGDPSCDKEVIEELQQHNKVPKDAKEFLTHLSSFNGLSKIITSYLENTDDMLKDGMYHPEYNINNTVTGRITAQFHSMPTKSDVKRLFISRWREDGGLILVGDYSQLELRIIASMSNESKFIEAFEQGHDAHANCYTDDTLILTINGFKHYTEISNDTMIAQYNPEIHKIEFVPAGPIYLHDYNGIMHHYKSRHVDVCVTPNHRMYIRSYTSNAIRDNYRIIRSDNISYSRFAFMHQADIKDCNDDIVNFSIPDSIRYTDGTFWKSGFIVKGDDFFELLGYLVTDGHFKFDNHKRGVVRISQHKPHIYKKIKECIDRIRVYEPNIPFTEYGDSNRRYQWECTHKEFCKYLIDNFRTPKVNMILPHFVKFASKRQLEIFINACMDGDGTFDSRLNRNSGSFITPSEQMAYDMQFIFMRLGYRSAIHKQVLKNRQDLYRISISSRDKFESQLSSNNVTNVNYSGKVFCYSVPSGLLVVNRNGKISIQGNTASIVFKVPIDKVTPEQRKVGKTLNFGIIFGLTDKSLANDIGCTIKEAKEIKEQLNAGCVNLDKWMKYQYKYVDEHGYIVTMFNRKIEIAGDEHDPEAAHRQAGNYPVQSSASDVAISSVVRLHKFIKSRGLRSIIIGSVHDSILVDIYPGELPIMVKAMKYICEVDNRNLYRWIKCPLVMDLGIGASWGGCIDIDSVASDDNNLILNGKGLRKDFNTLIAYGERCYNMQYTIVKETEITSFPADKAVKDKYEWMADITINAA